MKIKLRITGWSRTVSPSLFGTDLKIDFASSFNRLEERVLMRLLTAGVDHLVIDTDLIELTKEQSLTLRVAELEDEMRKLKGEKMAAEFAKDLLKKE